MLPVSFKHLIHLEFLSLRHCKKLKLRSDMLENITKLEIFDLNFCEEVEELPCQITNQLSLKFLGAHCPSLRYLRNDIGLLGKLNHLSIGSHLLTSLPNSLGNLSCLTCLYIGCALLTRLPSSLANLSCLTCFYIINCKKLEYTPHCIWGHKHLASIKIILSGVRELPFGAEAFSLLELKSLNLPETCLSEISISEDCCPNLKSMYISGNAQLMEIKNLPALITTISLTDCKVLKNIRCIGGVVNLNQLHISGCSEFDELPTFANLTLLKEFTIMHCPKVSRLDGIQHCRSLEKLEVETSWELLGIQSLEKADKLKELSVRFHTILAIKPIIQSIKVNLSDYNGNFFIIIMNFSCLLTDRYVIFVL